jgi:hypothetical protein
MLIYRVKAQVGIVTADGNGWEYCMYKYPEGI